MKIVKILSAAGLGGYFNDDQLAIKNGAERDGEAYRGVPETEGFSSVREPAQSLSIGLVLEDGHTVWGDMMSVQYAAACGRDPLFKTQPAIDAIKEQLENKLIGLDTGNFRRNNELIAGWTKNSILDHVGVHYGLSQALLQAAAHASSRTICEQVCQEYNLPLTANPVPLYAQTGDNRYINADKMILKSVDILPHGLFNSPDKFGHDGSEFLAYVKWLVARIKEIGQVDYQPILYFDVYGMPGFTLGIDPETIAEFFQQVELCAAPYKVRMESPVSMDSPSAQIASFANIRKALKSRNCKVEIAVDEWCNSMADIENFIAAEAADVIQIKMPDMGSIDNTIKAALHCKKNGVLAYIGGSCTETDLSARISTQIAVATQADMLLAKPGMGVDEGLMIVKNEQSRLLAVLQSR